MKTYRVEIVEITTGKVLSKIGHGLTKEQAEKRVETGVSRINLDVAFCREVEE